MEDLRLPDTIPPSPISETAPEPMARGLVIAWSKSEPHRAGEVAFVPEGTTLKLGPGADDDVSVARFVRQRPGQPLERLTRGGALAAGAEPANQFEVDCDDMGLIVFATGDGVLRWKGRQDECAGLAPGDAVLLNEETLLVCVHRAVTMPALRSMSALQYFGEPDAAGMVGESPMAWELRDSLASYGRCDSDLVVWGESGSGRSLAARFTHQNSRRADRPLIVAEAVTCVHELPLVELRGNIANYLRADMPAREGLVGQAGGGTLVLDTLDACSASAQASLRWLLDTHRCSPVGVTPAAPTDIRFVCTSSRHPNSLDSSLASLCMSGVRLPSLRERPEDIPLIVRHILTRKAAESPELAKRFFRATPYRALEPRISGRLMEHLVTHPLPGNVPELEALLTRAIERSPGNEIAFGRVTLRVGRSPIHLPGARGS